MELPRDALLLRIFLGEADELEGEPVFRKIVLKAREMNLGRRHGAARSSWIWKIKPPACSATFRISRDLPIVVEIVDTEEKIQEFLVAVKGIIGAGLVTLEKVQAIFYKAKPPVARDRS